MAGAHEGLKQALKETILKRRSARGFGSSECSPELLRAVTEGLGLAQRAPSGFNIQPWRCVLVKDDLVKEQLARCMVGGNIKRVLEAPVTTVWLADLQPQRLIERMIEMERKAGVASEMDLRNLRADANFLLGGFGGASANDENTSGGPDNAANQLAELLAQKAQIPGKEQAQDAVQSIEMTMKKGLLAALSQITQAPTINSCPEAWSFKNTMMAAQTYLLYITAAGYDSCPMEGFDARRIKEALSVPDSRFSIPIVISTGIASKLDDEEREGIVERPRYEFESVFSQDTFDFPLYKD